MINIPTNCPECDSILVKIKDQLFCRNHECEAKSLKQICHFAKTMKIKGLGEQTIKRLNFECITDIYNCTQKYLSDVLGDKLASKLFNEINNSKNTDLNTYIAAFGIPSIGNTTANKLADKCTCIWEITDKVCIAANIGNKSTENILKWIDKYKKIYYKLPITMTTKNTKSIKYKVVITGKLNDYSSRVMAKKYLESKKIQVLENLSSSIDYLICDLENRVSNSCKKAEKLNIPIITMNDLLNII